jgi:hypothetical protein
MASIYRDGMEIVLTDEEVRKVWFEYQTTLDTNEKDGWKHIVTENLKNYTFPAEREEDIREDILNRIFRDVIKNGVDLGWALADDLYGGFSEYFLDSVLELGISDEELGIEEWIEV